MTHITLALPDAAIERLEALARARGEPVEKLAERVLRSAADQVGGGSVLGEAQRAELRRRLAAGVDIADDEEVAAFFDETSAG